MTSSITFGGAIAAAALTIAGVRGATSPPAAPARHVVIAELFTSEGCSSCPPADRLLREIASTSPVNTVAVLALEEHVDYWDRLGWRDPFSSPVFTQRQTAYASNPFNNGDIYTPQLVIDGAFQAIGSDRRAAAAAIVAAATRPAAEVRVQVHVEADRAHLELTIEVPPSVQRHGTADLMVAVAEDGLTSHVGRGENSGLTLEHTGVVRLLTSAGAVPADAAARTLTADLPLRPEWHPERARIVAFLQERSSRKILGAGTAPLS